MSVHNSAQAHPTSRQLFDDLYIGSEIEAKPTVGFGNGGSKYTERSELLDQFNGIDVVLLKIVGYGYDLAIDKASHLGDSHLLVVVGSCMHRVAPSFFRYGTHGIRQQIGMLQNKGLEGLSLSRKVFLFQVDKEPLPHNRKAFNIENYETIGLKLHLERHTRDERNAQSRRDTLLDGTIVPHLHTHL